MLALRSFEWISNLLHSESYELPPYATVFKAEEEDINQGARLALKLTQQPYHENFLLCGDLTQHGIFFIGDKEPLSNLLAKSKTVLNCTKNLSQLNLTHKVTLHSKKVATFLD